MPEMPQFLPNTRARRINAFDAQYKTMENLHPEQALAEAIPIAHAKYQEAQEEKEIAKSKLSGYADELEKRDAREEVLVQKMNKNVFRDERYVNIAAKLDGIQNSLDVRRRPRRAFPRMPMPGGGEGFSSFCIAHQKH